ncbi:hypothetical protein ABL78_1251 [Leptomonas seymouri]|uniref:Uncharacterized protein n=1 Tax=Leptomonas seymouri TaxID=5684 RepID=A0A0N1PFZ8_LEPSE|nr:hypothetical protein ABL78_1251 [Leptomonas seymouri]|eukprot:KPI89670.1 hypothetical protein ABL78_1251 [Leptomonas seymouri]
MSLKKEPLPVRKLCSCNAVLCSPEEAKTAPSCDLFGVILLNSPANTEADFAEYVRLFQHYRGGGSTAGGEIPKNQRGEDISPYFICADGAYAALKRYFAAQAANAKIAEEDDAEDPTDVFDSSALMAMRLCDVLIGDMDSLSPAQLRLVAAVAAAAEDVRASAQSTETTPPKAKKAATAAAGTTPSTCSPTEVKEGPLYHETVAAIPVALLEVIRKRRDEALQRRRSPDAAPTTPPTDTPVVLPITCQMSTDFLKSVALLERLYRLEQGNTETLSEKEQAEYHQSHQVEHRVEELMKACDAQLEVACEESERQADGDTKEVERCRNLIMAVSPSSSCTVQTQVLPNVAVLGALGGRIDHEIGVMVTVMRFSRIFHLIVVNRYNVLFACWPDGVTQLLMPPSWKQQADLSRDSSVQATAAAAADPYMCGVVPFGAVRELETTGFFWNIVKNRRGCYDEFTGVRGYRFAFDGIVSVCNIVSSRLVTADFRPTTCEVSKPSWDPEAPSANPPALVMLGRPKSSMVKAASALKQSEKL